MAFPFNIRRSIGGWKLLFLQDEYVVADALPPEAARGRYLAEALAHCGECHTARGAFGQPIRGAWLGGAAKPGRGWDDPEHHTRWASHGQSAMSAAYLRDGFTPDFDSAGGEMASVIRNLANLPEEDHAAIAAYLQSVAPIE